MPDLFQRRDGTEDRPLTRSYIRECCHDVAGRSFTVAGQPLSGDRTISESAATAPIRK
jgi:hypothetical protein